MSYDVTIGQWSTNYTYNVGKMFHAAIGEGPIQWNGLTAPAVRKRCEAILAAFDKDPVTYEAMNPSNGWGSFDGARRWITEIRDACRARPRAKVRVS